MKTTITEAIADKTEEELISIGNLPLGQKLLALGIKPVTYNDLRVHFCADELEKKMNAPILYEERKTRVLKNWETHQDKRKYRRKLKKHLESKPAFMKTEKWEKEKGRLEEASKTGEYKGDDYYLYHMASLSLGFNMFSSHRYQVTIKYQKIDEYMEDTIPQYCLDQIEQAKQIGMDNFEVAYPVVEEVKQPDPVIISRLGDKMIWVTFYE